MKRARRGGRSISHSAGGPDRESREIASTLLPAGVSAGGGSGASESAALTTRVARAYRARVFDRSHGPDPARPGSPRSRVGSGLIAPGRLPGRRHGEAPPHLPPQHRQGQGDAAAQRFGLACHIPFLSYSSPRARAWRRAATPTRWRWRIYKSKGYDPDALAKATAPAKPWWRTTGAAPRQEDPGAISRGGPGRPPEGEAAADAADNPRGNLDAPDHVRDPAPTPRRGSPSSGPAAPRGPATHILLMFGSTGPFDPAFVNHGEAARSPRPMFAHAPSGRRDRPHQRARDCDPAPGGTASCCDGVPATEVRAWRRRRAARGEIPRGGDALQGPRAT